MIVECIQTTYAKLFADHNEFLAGEWGKQFLVFNQAQNKSVQ